MPRLFRNRSDAGRELGSRLSAYAARSDVIVLALPRGGVPVGYEVAQAIHAPLEIFVVRKLGVPGQEELAMGAIASGGVCVLNDAVIEALAIDEGTIQRAAALAREQLRRREELYRGPRPFPDVQGRIAILVDDGLATGATMRAAVRALRQHQPARIVVAVPVAAAETCQEMTGEADEVVCLWTPSHFMAVGVWYLDFSQTTDEEVRELLEKAGKDAGAPKSAS